MSFKHLFEEAASSLIGMSVILLAALLGAAGSMPHIQPPPKGLNAVYALLTGWSTAVFVTWGAADLYRWPVPVAGGAGFLAGLLAQPVTAAFVRRVRHAVANASFAALAPGAKTLDVLKALFGRSGG